MFVGKPARRVNVIWVGGALTWTAGFVDALGFLSLRQIYVANMSGNTIAVAIHLSKHDWSEAWAHLCPLLAFVPGLIAGDAIVDIGKRLKLQAALSPAVLLEAAALAVFLILGNRTISAHGEVGGSYGFNFAFLVGLLAFAMGLQNGAVRRIGALKDVHTYVTGTLLGAAHDLTGYFFWLTRRLSHATWPKLRRIIRYSPHHRSLRQASLAIMLWTLYLVGAVVGAIALMRYGIEVLLTPIGILLAIGLVDAFDPVRKGEPGKIV
jgi:uncharacterized membrane protein YoaK (UPF0700 family)